MKLLVALCAALAAVLIVAVGCSGGANDVTGAAGTHITVTASSSPAYTGSPIIFRVSAYNDQIALTSVAIDYTDDGTWDESITADRSTVSANFEHVYPAAGSYTIRVGATDTSGGALTITTTLSVILRVLVPVSYSMRGFSAQGGPCLAQGPPAECEGCGALLDGTDDGIARPYGVHPSGTLVTISQGFGQFPYVDGRAKYACTYSLRLLAGEPGEEVQIANETCNTSSLTNPATLSCFVTSTGRVP